jgi:hypothetical protein
MRGRMEHLVATEMDFWALMEFVSTSIGTVGHTGAHILNKAFDIHSPDVGGYDTGASGGYGPHPFDGAPSRPPSRISNNRSPHNVIDFSREAATG